ncbi:hydantoinase B/oxoprolinase family protein [Clostridium magnum]|uniref:Acetophenone carboxylase delta subunit n=1 Tax=Clostridium magnum DSM 2767 TaxID=1121326 RepID=A0A161W1F8_9CLOT|nr:hydantoinase B/oxoprolinase family protein [Clostridium magnum]KZL89000.1 acetophenone carboxylase delta subunit [Clostridium magnum DSM 2767]SHI23394.1 N-methylhydantoinase B [Clostridium magnum DSM 2767]
MNKQVDAVIVEIVGNLLLSIAEETGLAIIRSAYSTNIKERRDISTAVFDPEGNMVAQAEHVPMHLGSLLGIVKEVYKNFNREDIKGGDMFIGNDPYNGGGTHLPDITVVSPIFENGKLIGWVANLAHHSDVGGKVPGSTSGDAVSIFQEGTKIPLVRICKDGEICTDIVKIIMANSRIPNERYGDLQAQIAANRVGIRRMLETYKRYGDVLIESMYQLQDYAERKLKAGISRLPDGIYTFNDYMDDAGVAFPDPLKISVTITKSGDNMTLDFNGTDKQVEGPINVTYNGLLATVFYSLKALIDPSIPSNAGIYRAFNVVCEQGLLINAENPAPVGERIDTCQRIADVIFGALAPAVPERAIACCNSSVTSAIFSGTDPKDKNRFFVYLEVVAGGSGASKNSDGLSGVQVHMTNTSNLPVEALEMEFPLVQVRKYALRKDSGGAGRNRGGLGIVREFEIMYDGISYTGLGDRQKFPPWGLEDGLSGAGGAYYLYKEGCSEERLPSKCTDIPLKKGNIVSVYTPGSGGYGDPMTRDPYNVLIDVIEDKVSVDMAKKLYGVSVEMKNGTYVLNEDETRSLREER